MISFKNKKNIFIKNTNNTNNNSPNESENTSDLSDELNLLLGNESNKSNKTNTTNPTNTINKSNKTTATNTTNTNNEFYNISNIFKNISGVLNLEQDIKIIGEITSFKITDSNAWIKIKSDEYELLTIFWKIIYDKDYHKLKETKTGEKYIFKGKFAIMKKNLQIYFNVKFMDKFGKGDYLNIYEGYRLKIYELGLRPNKKQLEIFPYNIGIITALGGAAIQDILQTLKLDKFVGNIIIKNALVQGSQCPKSLIDSIEWFESNYKPDQIDLLMVTRGGGGWEDLVGFSDWNLIIKLSDSNFLTLSAVGHQIDNQLTDEICDYKFATPSIGAKFIVETQNKYRTVIKNYSCALCNLINKYNELKNKFNNVFVLNYEKIIKKYDVENLLIQYKKYSNQIKKILATYSENKNNFYSILSNLKPTIMRKNEITSIEDFINTQNSVEVKPKKIDIYFIDGMVKLSYKIDKYEKFN